MFFQPTRTIFELIHNIIGTNRMTKFHEDRTINVASRVLTRKNAPPPGGHIFQTTKNHFRTHATINVYSRVLTRKKAPPPGGHVFQQTKIIFELCYKDIIGINLLTKFHDDRTINVAYRKSTSRNAPPPGDHVFKKLEPFSILSMALSAQISRPNHEVPPINVASRVLTWRMMKPHDGRRTKGDQKSSGELKCSKYNF
ncbi:hypothetical protein DPMN_039301 [Dreissena polymorpha]|uniref:Uncharacterized protein n=1 Tax=Dreissena polymorpha TaxID=45954 RepID=A0A9D4MGY4_DREPO|nr:hypothetical protein DPMN_039301 [Dreissena polymorpha]